MSLVLNVEILGEFKKLTAATQGAQTSLQKLQDGVGGIARGIGRTVGALAVTLGFTSIVQGFKDSVQAAEEAQVANDRIDAIAESMNEFGNRTAQVTKRIKEFAEANALSVGVDDEVIKATQAKLLTFREVAKTADTMGGSFDRATIAALDMAAAGFGEATSNATQLGKALNNPITGITALNRAGIQFTEDQKALIASLVESGNVLKAQDIILTEIEAQVGGTSAATVTASERMAIAFGEVQESIGTVLMPAMVGLSDWLVETVPKIQAFFAELMDPTTEVGKAWQNLGKVFASTTDQFNKMLGVFGMSGIAFKDVLDFVTQLTAGFGQLFFMVGRVAGIIGALISLDIKKAFDLASAFGADYNAFVRSQNMAINPPTRGPLTPSQANPVQNVTINVNNSNITAQEIYDKIRRLNKASGTAGGNFFQ
jgi:hypothetical protein